MLGIGIIYCVIKIIEKLLRHENFTVFVPSNFDQWSHIKFILFFVKLVS